MIRCLYDWTISSGRASARALGAGVRGVRRKLGLSDSARYPDDPDDPCRPVARLADRGGGDGRRRCWAACSAISSARFCSTRSASRSSISTARPTPCRRLQPALQRLGRLGGAGRRASRPFPTRSSRSCRAGPGCRCRSSSSPRSSRAALRFFVLAALLWKFGAPIRDLHREVSRTYVHAFRDPADRRLLRCEVPVTRNTA